MKPIRIKGQTNGVVKGFAALDENGVLDFVHDLPVMRHEDEDDGSPIVTSFWALDDEEADILREALANGGLAVAVSLRGEDHAPMGVEMTVVEKIE